MTEPVIGVAASGAAPATTAAAAHARAGLELDLGMGGGDGLEQKIEHVVLDGDLVAGSCGALISVGVGTALKAMPSWFLGAKCRISRSSSGAS